MCLKWRPAEYFHSQALSRISTKLFRGEKLTYLEQSSKPIRAEADNESGQAKTGTNQKRAWREICRKRSDFWWRAVVTPFTSFLVPGHW